ncbi:MAG: MvaI/BcnI family restriction endonuclease, partial [Promethearchaeota archaeon]
MTLQEIKRRLKRLKEKGYIQSLRKGPTGIGFTLEKELNIKENNIAIPDIGGRVELKATRINASSLITLFTFNRGVWQIPQRKVIEKYGYLDEKQRLALYNLARVGDVNTQGLTLVINDSKSQVNLIHKASNTLIA